MQSTLHNVKPVKVKLGPNANKKERSFQYIPILATLKSFVENNSAFLSYPQNSADIKSTGFQDIHDWSVFKSNT